jgi:hypothetical protein
MRKRLALGLGAVGIFVVGLVAGALMVSGVLPAFASSGTGSANPATTTTKGGYCALYEQTLANELNTSTSKLEQANSDALQAVIKQMYADKKITAQQETKLLQQAANLKSGACTHLGALARRARRGAAGTAGTAGAGAAKSALAGARQAIEAQVAPALHLTVTQLDGDLKAGQTVSAIASTQKVDLATVKSTYLSAVQSELGKAVSAGTLTQPQSDVLYSRIEQAANAGHFPLLERGGPQGTGAGNGTSA